PHVSGVDLPATVEEGLAASAARRAAAVLFLRVDRGLGLGDRLVHVIEGLLSVIPGREGFELFLGLAELVEARREVRLRPGVRVGREARKETQAEGAGEDERRKLPWIHGCTSKSAHAVRTRRTKREKLLPLARSRRCVGYAEACIASRSSC